MRLVSNTSSKIRDQVSAAEWSTRVDLAALYRLVDHFEMTDFIYNHISARVPDSPAHFLMKPHGLLFEEVTASNLLTLNAKGEIVTSSEPDQTYNEAVPLLHISVLKGRQDFACVAHVHTPATLAVSTMDCGLLPITQTAMNLEGRIGYHDYGFDHNAEERLLHDFQDKDVVVLRNHGVLAGGRTIPEAFVNVYNFEFAAKAQVLAMAAEKHIIMPPADVVAASVAGFKPWFDRKGGPRDPNNCAEWNAAIRLLDRKGANFRD